MGIVFVMSIVGGGMKLEKQRLKIKAAGSEAADLKALVGDMHSEITKLKDRVRVLERLATDGDRNLADEIERLRRDTTNPRA
jgi:hypothetical protein